MEQSNPGKLQDTHIVLKEKTDILQKLLPLIDEVELLHEVGSLLDYFNSGLMKHFESEESLISRLGNEFNLTAQESAVCSRITADHVKLKDDINKLNSIIVKYDHKDIEAHEKILEIVNSGIETILAHADWEDINFYPFVKTKYFK